MRTSLAARLGSPLLLTLALCACPGGGDGGNDAPSDEARTLNVTPAVQVAADTCTGPPPTFSMALLNGGQWQTFMQALADSGVTFPDIAGNVDTLAVPLYNKGTPVRMEIRSSNSTACLSAGDLAGSNPRILGEYVLLEPFAGGNGWHALPAGARIYAFAQSKAGAAVMVYQHQTRTTRAPAASWQFWFCEDGEVNPRNPQARWRPRDTTMTGHPGQDTASGDDVGEPGDGDGGGSYGWMACISGCCQFYTPPPNEQILTTPEHANPKARDSVGPGMNQGNQEGRGQPVRPPWCKPRSS